MAIIRNAANTIRRGRVGEATYYFSRGQQVVREARNNSNYGETATRTQAQQNRRVLWANLVNFYKANQKWMPKAYESKAANQTDYNRFMQVNMSSAKIALTKDQAAAGACIADGYIVSQGSLPSVTINQVGQAWATNLALGDLIIGADTTNAQLTAALLANNANVSAGMQVSFVSMQQSIDALGYPRLITRCYEITLSTTSSELVRNYLPEFCSTSVNGNLGTNTNVSIGGFAYIMSENVNGTLRVSTQQLVINNATLISQYSSATQVAAACQSYGVDSEVILSPVGTNAQDAEAQPVYITMAKIYNETWAVGTTGPSKTDIGEDSIDIVFSAAVEGAPSQAVFTFDDGTSYRSSLEALSSDGKTVTFGFDSELSGNATLKTISFSVGTMGTYTAQWTDEDLE